MAGSHFGNLFDVVFRDTDAKILNFQQYAKLIAFLEFFDVFEVFTHDVGQLRGRTSFLLFTDR